MIKNNENNLGGQILITQQMLNHKKNLIKMKPYLNNMKKPREFTNKANTNIGKHKMNKEEEMREVHVFAKKVLNMKKGYVDTQAPQTSKFTHLKGKNIKNNKYINIEHNRNLKSMKNNIKNVNNLQNRKKNPYDPISHPVLCFREDQNKEEVKIDFFVNKIKNNRKPIIQNLNLIKKVNKNTIKVQNFENNNIDTNNLEIKQSNSNNNNSNLKEKNGLILESVPLGNINLVNCYEKLEEELIEFIISNRIYKDNELNILFKEFFKLNSDLDYIELEKVKFSILNDLDN